MERWNDKYGRVPIGACVDDAREIALGVSSVGVTVLANSRMGYWEFANVTRGGDEVVGGFSDVGGVGVDDDDEPSHDGRVRGGPSSTFG